MNIKPTEIELKARIEQQLLHRGNSINVALIWRGYLAALLEWGLLEPSAYDRLTDILTSVGLKEIDELFAGEALTAEREREIELHRRQ